MFFFPIFWWFILSVGQKYTKKMPKCEYKKEKLYFEVGSRKLWLIFVNFAHTAHMHREEKAAEISRKYMKMNQKRITL